MPKARPGAKHSIWMNSIVYNPGADNQLSDQVIQVWARVKVSLSAVIAVGHNPAFEALKRSRLVKSARSIFLYKIDRIP